MKFFNLNLLLILGLISCNKIENNQSSFKTKKPKKSIVVGEAKYDGPEKYMYYHAAVKHGAIDVNKPSRFNSYKPDYKRIELEKALKKLNNNYSRSSGNPNPTFSTYAKDNAVFIERGPYNAPGRTRALLVDASDSSKDTWIAGSVGGGVWKSLDGGTSWVSISNDMDNIAISWLGQSKSNTDVLYAATGENWIGSLGDISGAGVYKSINGGANWTNVSTKDNAGYVDARFSNVSRLIVDPNNSDVVVISTVGGGSSFIFKTIDGGTSWTKVSESPARIQQIIAAPSDFNIQYAVQRGLGVIRSIDAGSSWSNPGGIGLGGTLSYNNDEGIIGGGGGGAFGRLELAVSHQDPDIVFAGIDGDAASFLKISYNGGTTWNLLKNDDNTDDDWLYIQGWFDNTLTVNPFNDSIVYYAGRDASKATILSDAGTTFSGSTTKVTLDNTTSHMNLVNIWGGSALGSGTEWIDNSDNPDLVDIEVRFGPGKRQKAYRFSVPEGSTSGVAHDKYKYEGVVEVPFEVWNISTDPEQQLTVSFRDNANDGEFNLLAAQGDSREYIFPQSIPYDPDMDQSEIFGDGTPGNVNSIYGQLHKSLFLIWPFLADGVSWDPQNIPESKIKIEFIDATYKTLKKSVEYMTNQYDNGGAFDINENVHVDHHNLGTIVDSEVDSTFRIYLTTDGGIYYTISDKDPGTKDDHFKRAGLISDIMFAPGGGYNTTQFYGADKIAGFDQYVAGAQDNGTFYSPRNQDASDTTNYFHPIGGDGFEVIAHFTDSDKMFGGYQGNNLYYTHNGGSSWTYVGGSLTGSGPFINRASTSYQDPDVLYTISSSGVDKSSDFGVSWNHTQIGGTWGNSFWSGADVEVSLANPRFVYAGGVMDNTADIFISKDWGATFDPVSKFANLGTITGLYSHPNEDSTAYILFGIAGEAKIIETKNLGESWSDLSGFHLNVSGKSSNGFPDVAVYSFLVMPHDSNIMWAGTEIGLFESTNRGGSWHKVVGNLPNVTIWDMKIKDEGQVVFATHGRGIWTATLDDLKTFVPKPTTLAPNLLEGNQTDNDEKYEIMAKVELRSLYDSLEIKANSVLRSTYYDTDSVVIKEYTFEVDDKGDFSLQAFAYKDGVMYPSNIIEITVNPILDARTQFKTTFSDLVGDEFYLDRFRIGVQGGFEGRQLHTEHPYESGVDGGYTDGYSVHAMLNIPIIVTDFTPSIKFQEIVIVEPGEPGTSYGDAQFWDYVIVEASKDGITWKALLDGYDSDSDPTWKSAYATNQFGNPDLLRSKEANFKPHFNEGDTVKVRFRMFSDDLTVGWGWMVDDLYIQIETPVVQGIEFTKLDKNISVYPNPTNGIVNIKFNDTWRGDVNFKITDIFGRSITERILDNKNASSSHSIDISNSNDGVYIIQLLQGDKKTMQKVIKE
tara:strand:+ start:12665 stop:16888 length:4224 start_codon:yes stop_codon:yes gene_type:complete